MTSLFEILKASKGLPTDDMYTALLGRSAGGSPTPTEHEYTGVAPYSFNANGEPLLDWYIKGNTVQSGTPTPQNPVMLNGTGERTVNLFNKNDVEDIRVEYNGVETASNYYILSTFIPVNNGVTVSATKLLTDPIRIIRYDANKQFISRTDETTADNIVVDDCAYIRINANKDHWDINTIQVEYGRTATPYEPCGIKIPITSGGVNLFDPNSARYHMGKGTNNRIGAVANGAMFYIKAAPNTQYTIKIHTTDSTFVRLYLSNAPIVEGVGESYNVISESETTINPEATISNTYYTYLWIQTGGTWYTEHGGSSIMLNTGSTPLPYEPYNRTTTPVYLGEVETVRKIRKLELTGNETVAGSAVTGGWIITNLSDNINNSAGVQTAYCSHYLAKNNGAMSSLSQGEMCISTQVNNRINFVTTFATAEDFKSYLAQQYANGTPVCVWYVLATPETGIVNEPLQKIGDYADEVSNVATIPTVNGSNTFDVDTTMKPSEVYIKYTG